MCISSSKSISFFALASFLSQLQQLIWQLIFRFGSALPQENPEDNELTEKASGSVNEHHDWGCMTLFVLCSYKFKLKFVFFRGMKERQKSLRMKGLEAHKPDRSIVDDICCFFSRTHFIKNILFHSLKQDLIPILAGLEWQHAVSQLR